MIFLRKHFTTSLGILGLLMFCAATQAHQMSRAYLQLSQQPIYVSPFGEEPNSDSAAPSLYGQLQIRWFDLELVVPLDANSDGELSWAEVNAGAINIQQFILQHLSLTAAGTQCPLQIENDIQTDSHFDEGYLVVSFSIHCPLQDIKGEQLPLIIDYDAIFPQDAAHTLLINAELFKQELTGVIDKQNQRYQIEAQSNPILGVISTYIYQGILHIFMGTDHILFLFALLLTCVLHRENKQWQAKSPFKTIFKDTAWIITAFTVAHSITLTATAMDLILPSSRWVEFGIALSVMLTALNNIWPLVTKLGWLTFGFGLLHGMGFAGVLGELGIAKEQKLVSVLSFNLGVEFGQLMILSAVMPILLYVGKRTWYQKYGMQLGSALIALIALQWCIERF